MMKLHLNDIKLVAFDVGKTLFDKNKQDGLTCETITMIKELKKRGIKVGVCTMRTINICKKLIPVPLDFYISLNGAYVSCDNQNIINLRINNDFKEEILTYGKSTTYYSSVNSKILAKNTGFLTERKGILKRPYVITLFNKNKKDADMYKEKYSCSYWENTGTITLQSKLCNKIDALKKVLDFYHIKDDQFLFFGDGPNDMDIFRYFEKTIMVGNGYPELMKYAYDVCGNCEDNGVSNYIFGLF